MRRFAHCLALLLVAASPAASDVLAFRAPSGNINCVMATGDWSGVRCDLTELTPSFPVRPMDCDLDWGSVFWLGPTGRGEPTCVGDTVTDPNAFTLEYGKSVRLGALMCISERTGMTCTNGQGHGFILSRARQQMF